MALKKRICVEEGKNVLRINIEVDKHFSITGDYLQPIDEYLKELGMSYEKAEEKYLLCDIVFHNGKEYNYASGGRIHNTILRLRPDLKNLVKMHLSDAETGKPMYAYENGRYWYAKDQQKGIEYLRAENVKVKDSYFDTLFVKMLPIWKKECIQAMKIINSL